MTRSPREPAPWCTDISTRPYRFQSTIEALESLYPRLSPGGFCIIDDYGLAPCARAVEEYRTRAGIAEPLEKIDWSGVFWRKS